MKKQRNDILKNEKSYILKNIPDGNDNIKEYFKSKIKYFDDQRDHYIKHSFFEKSWIIDHTIVFKPIEQHQFRELREIEESLKKARYRGQIKKMLDKNEEYINEELSLVKAHIKKNRPFWNIENIETFSREKHYTAINSLKHFSDYTTIDDYHNKNNIFNQGVIGSSLRNRIINDLKKPENKVVYVIGPPQTSKTYMLTSVCEEVKNKNIFAGVIIFKLEKEKNNKSINQKSNFVESFIRKVSSFLADQCDFWFFNRLRTANEVEKSHWNTFFGQLEKGRYLICFDDFNNLPNRNEKAFAHEFLTRMFKRLKKTKFLIFTTQRPIHYYDESVSKEYRINFDDLANEKNADKFIENLINNLSIDKKYIDKVVRNILKKLVIKYHNFPALIFTKFKEESNYFINKGRTGATEFDHAEMIAYIDRSIANKLYKEIYEKLGEDTERKIISCLAGREELKKLDLDAGAIAADIFGKDAGENAVNDVKKSLESLKLRKLIYREEDGNEWRIDGWWKAILK